MAESILIVDDEKDIVDLVSYNLAKAGYRVERCFDGDAALRQIQARVPDMLILDLMLPGVDGLEVCRRLKADKRTARLPILMLTAKGEETDRVVGLEMGADDYVTKPFSPRELMARVKAVLRRGGAAEAGKEGENAVRFEAKGLSLDSEKHEVRVRDKVVDLTAKEFQLLAFMGARQGRVLTRDFLLGQIWDLETEVETRTVDVHIRRLREKLGPAAKLIRTVRGVGYKFQAER